MLLLQRIVDMELHSPLDTPPMLDASTPHKLK
jgi:hypothetical protein